jgi:hypothetical protein
MVLPVSNESFIVPSWLFSNHCWLGVCVCRGFDASCVSRSRGLEWHSVYSGVHPLCGQEGVPLCRSEPHRCPEVHPSCFSEDVCLWFVLFVQLLGLLSHCSLFLLAFAFSSWSSLITKKISTCKFSVYFYETVAQTYHKNTKHGIFENILTNTGKVHKPNIDVYGVMDPNRPFL